MRRPLRSLLRTLLAGSLALPAAAEEALRYEPPPPGSYELPALGQVSERRLLLPDGVAAPLLGLSPGQVALVSFVYRSCPDACPAVLATWKRIDTALSERPELRGRVRLVSVSFDPGRDTPGEMAALARALAPRGDWRFLTAGSAAELVPLLADFGQDATPLVDAEGKPTGLVRHVTKAFLVDSRLAIRNVYSTGFLSATLLLNDAETVLREESGAMKPASPGGIQSIRTGRIADAEDLHRSRVVERTHALLPGIRRRDAGRS